MSYSKHIARINYATLGFEDHGIFSFNIDFDFGGSGQGTGHRALVTLNRDDDLYVGAPWAAPMLRRILEVCSVGDWSKLPGRQVYVLKEADAHWNAPVLGIEALPFDGGESKQLVFEDFAKSYMEPVS